MEPNLLNSTSTRFLFPDKTPLGGLYLADCRFPHSRKWCGEACGSREIVLSAEKMLGLQISGQLDAVNIEACKDSLGIFSSLDLSTMRYCEESLQAILSDCPARELRLDFLPFNDEHVNLLSGATGLRTLWLLHTAIRNKGIKKLASLPELRHLVLKNTEITDGALVHLKESKSLTTLLLPRCITDRGLEEIRDLEGLLHLDVSGASISGLGIEHIATMLNLQSLYLSDCDITDDALSSLSKLADLRVLCLSGTRVSDACVEHVERLSRLEYLEIRGSGLTEIAAARIRTRLPACNVVGP